MTEIYDKLPLLLLKAREQSIAYLRPVLSNAGLTEQQWRVIEVLAEDKELNARDLAERSFILSPSLSRILSRLELDGLLLKRAQKDDQRVSVIKLSAKGRRLYKRLKPKIDEQYQLLIDSIGESNLSKLAALLNEINDIQDIRPSKEY